ncbi:MAG: hypothetical protein R3F56_17615 [Planctomycetota bacterium]
MNRPLLAAGALATSALLLLAACSSRREPSTLPGTSGDFFVLSSSPTPQAEIYLNDAIRITFTRAVDLSSADFNAVAFTVFDLNGNALQELPRGTFSLEDADDGSPRVLRFDPAFPRGAAYDDGGFRPARRYVMQLATGDARNRATLRGDDGRGLSAPFTLTFHTVEGRTPSQLFRDQVAGGPRVIAASATPRTGDVVGLGQKGLQPVEVRVVFDQPLDPNPSNVPTALDPSPALVDPRQIDVLRKGRVFLEYDDPEYGRGAWIPATVSFERNDNDGAALVLSPTGVLPNDAAVRLIVEPSLQDLSGQSNSGDVAFARTAFAFRTEEASAPQFDAIVETFADLDQVDLEPSFLEPLAEFGPGFVRAGFAFEGTETVFDYRPASGEVELNTDFALVAPANGSPFSVSGGVFQFRNVVIPANATVRGTGTKPMVWLVTGDFTVEGELTVAGGDGARVDGLNSANIPIPGGIGRCGGGNGGRGSPLTSDTDDRGETGYGPAQAPGGGGRGGEHACHFGATCLRGGGGGGGSFTTQGDPHHQLAWLGQPAGLPLVGNGRGGPPCQTPAPMQAAAGPLAFSDPRRDNDFWGTGIRLGTPSQRVAGELLVPRGGAGGGGGGDSNDFQAPTRCSVNPTFVSDRRGAGGGAGGGVLIIKALGRIVVKSGGRITATGGSGGGGEPAGSCGAGGGGGGGSGGMVVLMSARGIHISRHGAPYADASPTSNANGAYSFAIDADGGFGRRGTYANPYPITGKYPGRGGPAAKVAWDYNPVGGFGGLGLIQLMAPPGDNLDVEHGGDGTRTRLDDNLYFYPDDEALLRGLDSDNPHRRDGPALKGTDKERLLGWRGFPGTDGVGRDDAGVVVELPHDDHGEGDLRPAPVLLPAPFGAVSRLRSRWIDTGATARRTASGGARRIEERLDPPDPDNPFTNLRAGPTYVFAGTFHSEDRAAGYVRYRDVGGQATLDAPEVLPAPLPVTAVESGVAWRGASVYRVRLGETSTVLARIPGRYTGYQAELRDVRGTVIASRRIVGHDGDDVYLSADEGLLDAESATVLQVVTRLFEFATDGATGFGPSYLAGSGPDLHAVPYANARIGFAFHVAPAHAHFGHDELRIPPDSNEFLFDLDVARPEAMREVRALGKAATPAGGAIAVQYDVLFNMAYSEDTADHVDRARVLTPASPRPELRSLTLPFQF